MGEKKEKAKNEAGKTPDSGGKQNDVLAPVVLRLEMHCEGCVKKIKRVVRNFDGVEDVKADLLGNKLTVIGKVDSAVVRDKLADKTRKKVEIISPQPKKDSGAASKPPEKKVEEKKTEEKKPADKKTEEKTPKQSTVVLKIRLHCDGCIQKIRKIILRIKGVESVKIEGGKDLVTVNGTVEVKELVAYLNEKLKRNVEVVPLKKEGENKQNKKEENKKEEKGKEKKEGGGGGKKDGGEKEEGVPKVEVNKMEHYGYVYPPPPMYWYDGYAPGQSSTSGGGGGGYTVGVHSGYDGNYGNYHDQYHNGYGNQGYMVQQPPPPPFYLNPYHPPPQMFSDENPNACFVM
ncbi:heavy metal-associated isoprenylated plant protein 6 [Vigna radiata var. radiata]|uniref:Heavy metal-associated isoprenylated plant protein 6 n=1 Tax=Vigna radiata var. radiata TaxID=3916 RepID=A0A1S3TNV3_VIGRR|nr:heavy metal-associated isoprenylated plant protein 6 [Vigna radiata var. radiata]